MMTGIKLEVGKRYRDREGRVYGPLFGRKGYKNYPFGDRQSARVWAANGSYYGTPDECEYDLIALAPDEAPEPQPDDLAALRAERDDWRDAALRWQQRTDSAEAENARLREALEGARDRLYALEGLATHGATFDAIQKLDTALTAKEPAR